MPEPDGFILLAVAIVIVFAIRVSHGVNPVVAGILRVAAFTDGVALSGCVREVL